MPTISVVMPTYNAAKYIAQTFDSLIDQTFGDWECIVVDDGSTDDTAKVVAQYIERDNRFSYHRIENSGYGKYPRDIASSKATADWVLALDSDDYLAPTDYLEQLLARQGETGALMVLPRMYFFDNDTEKLQQFLPAQAFDMTQVLEGKEVMMLTIGGWQIGANGALIKRSIWQAKKHYLDGFNLFGSDEYDTRELMLLSGKVAFCADAHYYYRQHALAVTKKVSPKMFELLAIDLMLADLVELHCGKESAEARLTQDIALNGVLFGYVKYNKLKSQLSAADRKQVKQFIAQQKKQLSRGYIWQSDLHLIKKVLLLLPTSITIAFAWCYAKIR